MTVKRTLTLLGRRAHTEEAWLNLVYHMAPARTTRNAVSLGQRIPLMYARPAIEAMPLPTTSTCFRKRYSVETRGAFIVNTIEEYPLKYSVILNPASTISITNNGERLVNPRPATHDDYIWSGDRQLPVTAYGTMLVRTGNSVLHLENVALCPRILTTLVSLRQLRRKGMFWDNEHDPTTLRRRDKSILCPLTDIHRQYVIEH